MTTSKQYHYHTVSKRILGDLLTPVSVYILNSATKCIVCC